MSVFQAALLVNTRLVQHENISCSSRAHQMCCICLFRFNQMTVLTLSNKLYRVYFADSSGEPTWTSDYHFDPPDNVMGIISDQFMPDYTFQPWHTGHDILQAVVYSFHSIEYKKLQNEILSFFWSLFQTAVENQHGSSMGQCYGDIC